MKEKSTNLLIEQILSLRQKRHISYSELRRVSTAHSTAPAEFFSPKYISYLY